MFHQKLCLYHGTNYEFDEENQTLYLDHRMSRSLGLYQVEVHGSTNFNTFKLAIGVSCAHTYASLLVVGTMLAQNPTKKYD
jgi:hypothetical protein